MQSWPRRVSNAKRPLWFRRRRLRRPSVDATPKDEARRIAVNAASYEAKHFGVRGGMSGWRARELCPQLIFVDGHFGDYQRLGDAAIKVLNDFTPLVERISIDEAFADVAGCTHLFGSPAEIASAVRRRVRTELGLPISVVRSPRRGSLRSACLQSGSWRRYRNDRSRGYWVPRPQRSSPRWPGIAIRDKSRRIGERDRPEHSRHSARSQLKSVS
jgi:hypothetical protein